MLFFEGRSGSGFSYFDIFQLQGGCFSEADRQPIPGLNPIKKGKVKLRELILHPQSITRAL